MGETPGRGGGEDYELANAVLRSPVKASGQPPQLALTLGYMQPFAAQTMQPAATAYFRQGGDATLAAAPPFPQQLAAAAPAAAVPPAAPPVHVRRTQVFEESIATGNFKRVNMPSRFGGDGAGGGAAAGASAAAAFLRAKLLRGKAAGGAAWDDDDLDGTSEPPFRALQRVVRSGCRIAQGLFAGVLLVVLMLMARPGLADAPAFVAALGDVVGGLRFAMYVLAVLSWLGAAEQALDTRLALGRWFGPFQPDSTAAVALVGSVRWSHVAVVAYSLAAATVFASMPMDNRIRAGARLDAAGVAGNAALVAAVAGWRALVAIRFAAVMVGYAACNATSAAAPDVYTAVKQAADLEVTAANQSRAVAVAVASSAISPGQLQGDLGRLGQPPASSAGLPV